MLEDASGQIGYHIKCRLFFDLCFQLMQAPNPYICVKVNSSLCSKRDVTVNLQKTL